MLVQGRREAVSAEAERRGRVARDVAAPVRMAQDCVVLDLEGTERPRHRLPILRLDG